VDLGTAVAEVCVTGLRHRDHQYWATASGIAATVLAMAANGQEVP
jgi:hypothetical protein